MPPPLTFLSVALWPNTGHGLLILEVSRSHTTMHQSVGFLWTSDQLVAETSTWQQTTLTTDRNPCPRFESTISAGERPQTYALDRAATGTGNMFPCTIRNIFQNNTVLEQVWTYVYKTWNISPLFCEGFIQRFKLYDVYICHNKWKCIIQAPLQQTWITYIRNTLKFQNLSSPFPFSGSDWPLLSSKIYVFNALNAELNPRRCLLALLVAHHFLHVSRIRVKSLTLRLLMSYIYIYIWSTHSWCF